MTNADTKPVDSLSDILGDPPRTARTAVGSLVSALLVVPCLVGVAVMLMSSQGTPSSSGAGPLSTWEEVDPATGQRVHYMEYFTDQGARARLGPSPTPLGSGDVPPPPENPGAQAVKVVAFVVLFSPLVLEVLAILLGISGLHRISASAGALTGRAYAVAGLVIAGINGMIVILVGAALGLLVMWA